MGISIQKTGIIPAELHSEFIANAFDTTTYVEPDGSVWIRIIHHNNPTNAKFASTDTFTSQVYKDADRWFNGALCNYLSGSWELLLKQMPATGGTEVKYRWIQTVNPMTATFDQTKAANVTKITTSGYGNKSAYGGVYYNNGSNSWLVCNNSTSGNWFGALGCWNAYNGGIPGYDATITTGYMDLYLRMDSKSNLSRASIGTNFMKTHEFIEVY